MKSPSFMQWTLLLLATIGLSIQLGCGKPPTVTVNDPAPSSPPQIAPQSAPAAGYQFETPVRLKAGGEYVSVEAPGYACPTMADVDDDGDLDLVVGQFNKGHMQLCINKSGSGKTPEFEAAEWIQSGDKRAEVPGVW